MSVNSRVSKAFVCTHTIGVSALSLHRECTNSLIVNSMKPSQLCQPSQAINCDIFAITLLMQSRIACRHFRIAEDAADENTASLNFTDLSKHNCSYNKMATTYSCLTFVSTHNLCRAKLKGVIGGAHNTAWLLNEVSWSQ